MFFLRVICYILLLSLVAAQNGKSKSKGMGMSKGAFNSTHRAPEASRQIDWAPIESTPESENTEEGLGCRIFEEYLIALAALQRLG